ncbi:ATP-dependent zinc protease family protein [Kushneria aurantia]|uniref:ATP-dependent zinc protease n=1 Tax=Kushneria aurantia TaxID=504092 RepID=A0ABV6G8U0_9GAMM|nr:RimK/LysX family protein [Kushneria aurantia]
MNELPYEPRAIVGRREMVTLPDLSLRLACKIDTGARTSALHAEGMRAFEEKAQWWVSFDTWSGDDDRTMRRITLPLSDRRKVRSSNGHASWRYVIRTTMLLGTLKTELDLTLVDRSAMRHPMLLGRRAMKRVLVAPGASFLHGTP